MKTEYVLLSALSEFKNGKFLPTNERLQSGKYDVYGSNGKIAKTTKSLYQQPVIVIGRVGANCGAINFTKKSSWITDNCIVAIPKSETDFDFLYYLLRFLKLNNLAIGSAQPMLTQDLLNSIEILNFDSPEKEKIGKILSDLDSKIQNLQKQNRILEQMVQTIFKSWFIDFDGVTEFEDSELGQIPKGWKVKLFKEIGECVKGFSYKGIEKFTEPRGFEFVTLNSIKEGGGFKKKFTWLESDRLKERHFVNELDLIIANTEQTKDARLLATPALVQFSYDYDKQLAVYSHHITKIKSKIKNSKSYLYSFFLYYQENIANAYHTGTGVWGFDHKSFEENHLTLKPTDEVLEKFENMSSEIHTQIIENEKSISVLTNLHDSLLPKLMSGEIRV